MEFITSPVTQGALPTLKCLQNMGIDVTTTGIKVSLTNATKGIRYIAAFVRINGGPVAGASVVRSSFTGTGRTADTINHMSINTSTSGPTAATANGIPVQAGDTIEYAVTTLYSPGATADVYIWYTQDP